MIDLHVHINEDDARYPVDYVVDCAAKQGISALGIVVHDYVGHMEQAVLSGRARGIESFAVTELSGKDGHYLMFFPDFRAAQDDELNSRLLRIYSARRHRLELLASELGGDPLPLDVPGYGELLFRFSMEDLERVSCGGRMLSGHLSRLLSEQAGNAVAGRAAYVLLKGFLSRSSYSRFPEYVDSLLGLDELARLRDRFGGVLIEAHPHSFCYGMMRRKIEAGVDGFEVSARLDRRLNAEIVRCCAQEGLLVSVGTDNHMWESEKLGLHPALEGIVDENLVLEALFGRLGSRA